MTDAELFTIIKSVDPQAVRLPPGIRAIAAAISAVKDAEIDRLRGALITGASLLEQGCNTEDMAAAMRRAVMTPNV